MSNVAINTLQFINEYDRREYCGYHLRFHKEGIWTPHYAIFNVDLELCGWPEFYMSTNQVLDGLKAIVLEYVPQAKLQLRYGCNEFELSTDEASDYFAEHDDIMEAICEQYRHAVVFLTK